MAHEVEQRPAEPTDPLKKLKKSSVEVPRIRTESLSGPQAAPIISVTLAPDTPADVSDKSFTSDDTESSVKEKKEKEREAKGKDEATAATVTPVYKNKPTQYVDDEDSRAEEVSVNQEEDAQAPRRSTRTNLFGTTPAAQPATTARTRRGTTRRKIFAEDVIVYIDNTAEEKNKLFTLKAYEDTARFEHPLKINEIPEQLKKLEQASYASARLQKELKRIVITVNTPKNEHILVEIKINADKSKIYTIEYDEDQMTAKQMQRRFKKPLEKLLGVTLTEREKKDAPPESQQVPVSAEFQTPARPDTPITPAPAATVFAKGTPRGESGYITVGSDGEWDDNTELSFTLSSAGPETDRSPRKESPKTQSPKSTPLRSSRQNLHRDLLTAKADRASPAPQSEGENTNEPTSEFKVITHGSRSLIRYEKEVKNLDEIPELLQTAAEKKPKYTDELLISARISVNGQHVIFHSFFDAYDNGESYFAICYKRTEITSKAVELQFKKPIVEIFQKFFAVNGSQGETIEILDEEISDEYEPFINGLEIFDDLDNPFETPVKATGSAQSTPRGTMLSPKPQTPRKSVEDKIIIPELSRYTLPELNAPNKLDEIQQHYANLKIAYLNIKRGERNYSPRDPKKTYSKKFLDDLENVLKQKKPIFFAFWFGTKNAKAYNALEQKHRDNKKAWGIKQVTKGKPLHVATLEKNHNAKRDLTAQDQETFSKKKNIGTYLKDQLGLDWSTRRLYFSVFNSVEKPEGDFDKVKFNIARHNLATVRVRSMMSH